MTHHAANVYAMESVALLWNAFSLLDMNLGVCSFDMTPRLIHSLSESMTSSAAARVLSKLTFDSAVSGQENSDFAKLMESSLSYFQSERRSNSISDETLQLMLIVSDGRILGAEHKRNVRKYVRMALSLSVLPVFIMLDNFVTEADVGSSSHGELVASKSSILSVQSASMENGKVVLKSYLDSFPFPYYVVVQNMQSLPSCLADSLREWFEVLHDSHSR